jgi:hypothetical protein
VRPGKHTASALAPAVIRSFRPLPELLQESFASVDRILSRQADFGIGLSARGDPRRLCRRRTFRSVDKPQDQEIRGGGETLVARPRGQSRYISRFQREGPAGFTAETDPSFATSAPHKSVSDSAHNHRRCRYARYCPTRPSTLKGVLCCLRCRTKFLPRACPGPAAGRWRALRRP